MGAAMASLTTQAHVGRPPSADALGLGLTAAIVLAATALITTSLEAWRDRPRLYGPLFVICILAGVACVGLGLARPTPLVLGLTLVGLFSIPRLFAVLHIANHEVRLSSA
jgi:hypothetical protein